MTPPAPAPASDAAALPPLVVWGAGGHARVVSASVRRAGRWRVAGFIDDQDPARAGEAFAGATVLGGRAALDALRAEGVVHLHLAFGHNAVRRRLAVELAHAGFLFPTLADPLSLVADDASLGDGCFVGPGAVVNAGARLGRQVIVNTGAIVEHDAVVGDAAPLPRRACPAGHVHVGPATFIGAGAVVRDRVRIGAGCTIGLGSVVVRDLPDGVLAYGCPATPHGNLP